MKDSKLPTPRSDAARLIDNNQPDRPFVSFGHEGFHIVPHHEAQKMEQELSALHDVLQEVRHIFLEMSKLDQPPAMALWMERNSLRLKEIVEREWKGNWQAIEMAPRGGNHGKLIVTNNLHAKTAFGFMSHAWLVSMIHDTPEGVVAFCDETMVKIHGLTHFLPLTEPSGGPKLARIGAHSREPQDRRTGGGGVSVFRGSRCGLCYWALYDGCWCQNPSCEKHGKEVGDDRIHLSNAEAAILIANKTEENEQLRDTVKGLSEIIESQKQTADAILKRVASVQRQKEEMEEDKERMDWLEANPGKLANCTWMNVHLGRLFSFDHTGTLGECPRTLRQAVDQALQSLRESKKTEVQG